MGSQSLRDQFFTRLNTFFGGGAADRSLTSNREEPHHLRPIENGDENRRGDGDVYQTVAVLGEGRGTSHAIIGTETDEPAVRRIDVELLDQKPPQTDRIDEMRPHGLEQLVERYRGAADPPPAPDDVSASNGDSASYTIVRIACSGYFGGIRSRG